MTLDRGLVIAAFVVLLLMSAVFSAAEAAFAAVSRSRLSELERRGNRQAARAVALSGSRERLIGTLRFCNTLATAAIAALAAVVLDDLFGNAGVAAAAAATAVLVLLFGELLPRAVAVTGPERIAIAAAPIVGVLVAVVGPLVAALGTAVRKSLSGLGLHLPEQQGVFSAHEELRGAIDLHLQEGAVVKKDHDMLGGLLDLQQLAVADLMVHRTKMTLIDIAGPPADIVGTVLKSGHTRIPVWKEKPDNIVGVLHAKNLFAALQKHGGDAARLDIADILSPAWFVPDTRAIPDQLNAFLRRKTHFAIVVDEYGEVQGLITLEDIIEEIVGDIKDEHDAVATGVRPKPDGSFVVDGGVPVRDLNRAFGWQLPDDEATTIAGLVIHEARMIPSVGQTFNFHQFQFEVLRKRKHQLTSIRVMPLRRPGDAAPPG